jgi:hypothetical protein
MIDIDLTRLLAVVALVILCAIYATNRREHARNERRLKLQSAALNFAEAFADFAEDAR